MNPLVICIIIFLFTVISFMLGKITMGTTALISMVLLVVFGCISPETALSGFANPNTIIIATMFVVSAGFSKTQMVANLSSLVGRVSKGSFIKVLAGYVLITALLAQVIQSAMAVFSIVFPLACAMCDELKISRSKMMFSIGIVSISTVSILPLGQAAVAFVQYNGMLGAYQYTDYMFTMLDPMIARLPSMIFIVLYAIFVAPKFAPDQPVVATTEVQGKGGMGAAKGEKLSAVQEVVGYATFFLVILGMLTSSLHGLDLWVITFTGALLMVISGVLKPAQAYAALSLGGIVMLYVGVLALGTALTETGAGELVGGAIASVAGRWNNGYVLGLIFFLVPFLLTQIMMNAAVLNIFIPIAILTCQSLSANPLGPMILVVIGSLTAFMTPMATPAVSMMMGLGGYDQKTMIKMSWMPALCMCAINVLWVMTLFPA